MHSVRFLAASAARTAHRCITRAAATVSHCSAIRAIHQPAPFRAFSASPASIYRDVDGVPQVSSTDAKAHRANFDLVVDVRELDEVKQGMIDGAKHIPMAQAIKKAQSPSMQSLTKGRKVLVYCRGGVRSQTVAKAWRTAGIDAINLADGFAKWSA